MRLILVGTEQPNLHVLEALASGRSRPAEVLVIGHTAWRSTAMLPGLAAGRYSEDDVTVDVAAFARAAGAELLAAPVRAIDAAARTITLEGGRTESWDLLSLALPLPPAVPDLGSDHAPVRTHAWTDVDALLRDIDLVRQSANGRGISIAVVGAGTTGFEVACALASRLDGMEPRVSIRVVDADAGVLADREPASRRLATRLLLSRHIGLALGARVEAVTDRGLRLASGASVPADMVVWCTGGVPPAMLSRSGLALDQRGFADVDGTLRSTSHPAVFVTSRPDLLREGDVLAHNVAVASGALPGKSFRTRRPPDRPPAILYSGGDTALVSFGSLAREAGWAFRLKDRLDRRFVERFRKG
jgi:NADH dehydrogenase FAD-containing subunit